MWLEVSRGVGRLAHAKQARVGNINEYSCWPMTQFTGLSCSHMRVACAAARVPVHTKMPRCDTLAGWADQVGLDEEGPERGASLDEEASESDDNFDDTPREPTHGQRGGNIRGWGTRCLFGQGTRAEAAVELAALFVNKPLHVTMDLALLIGRPRGRPAKDRRRCSWADPVAGTYKRETEQEPFTAAAAQAARPREEKPVEPVNGEEGLPLTSPSPGVRLPWHRQCAIQTEGLVRDCRGRRQPALRDCGPRPTKRRGPLLLML